MAFEYEAGWAPEPAKRKIPSPCRELKSGPPASSLVTILTELSPLSGPTQYTLKKLPSAKFWKCLLEFSQKLFSPSSVKPQNAIVLKLCVSLYEKVLSEGGT
jgi:hypothetical protein